MVIKLDLRTTGVCRYIARLNLMGGMAVSLFFQGGDGGGGGRGGGRGGGETKNNNKDKAAPPPWMGMVRELVDMLHAYGQHVPRELLALGPPPPLWIRRCRGGGRQR